MLFGAGRFFAQDNQNSISKAHHRVTISRLRLTVSLTWIAAFDVSLRLVGFLVVSIALMSFSKRAEPSPGAGLKRLGRSHARGLRRGFARLGQPKARLEAWLEARLTAIGAIQNAAQNAAQRGWGGFF